MHYFLLIAALSALLSAGCTLSRSTAASTPGASTIARPIKQTPARNLAKEETDDADPTDFHRVIDRELAAMKFDEREDERRSRSSQKIRQVSYRESADAADSEESLDRDERSARAKASLADEEDTDSVLTAVPEMPIPQTGVFSLAELTSITEQEHPRLRQAMSEIESAMGERVQAGLYPNPRMETNNPEIWSGRDSQINFGWQQDVITKGKMRLDKAAADQKVRVEESQYVIERMRVLTEVRVQYIRALAARERLRNSEEILTISRSARDVSVELMDTGERNLTDVLLLKNQYERARLAVENNFTNFEAELRQLAIATGIPDLVVTDVTGTIDEQPPYYDEPYLREFLQSNSAYIIMARAEVVRRKILLNRAEVEPYPDFRLGPHYAASTTQGSNREFWFTFVFDIPIWNLNQGNIRSARAEVAGAQAKVEERRMELLTDLSEIHARHKTSQLMLARIESSILPNAVHTQQLVQEGYSQGVLDVNRMLEAQRALLEAKQDQIDAYEQAWRTAAELAGYLQFEQFP